MVGSVQGISGSSVSEHVEKEGTHGDIWALEWTL